LPKVKTEVIYGGASRQDQVKMLKGENPPHIIVGTPGRILSLVKTKDLVLDNLQTFVLDECDKMLEETDMRRDVQSIFMSTPPQK
jgi:ATP-dependent RNA helicase UAP56/SUB2